MTIANKIDSILQEKHMSRRKLAQKAGVPPSSFQSAMERGGDMPVSTLQKIAAALEIDAFELLDTNRDQAVKDARFHDIAPELYQLADDRLSEEEILRIKKLDRAEIETMHATLQILEDCGYQVDANFQYSGKRNLIVTINGERRRIGLTGAQHILDSFKTAEQSIVAVSQPIDPDTLREYERRKAADQERCK